MEAPLFGWHRHLIQAPDSDQLEPHEYELQLAEASAHKSRYTFHICISPHTSKTELVTSVWRPLACFPVGQFVSLPSRQLAVARRLLAAKWPPNLRSISSSSSSTSSPPPSLSSSGDQRKPEVRTAADFHTANWWASLIGYSMGHNSPLKVGRYFGLKANPARSAGQ